MLLLITLIVVKKSAHWDLLLSRLNLTGVQYNCLAFFALGLKLQVLDLQQVADLSNLLACVKESVYKHGREHYAS